MKTHVSIMAHADAKDTFLRHFRYWKMQAGENLDNLMVWMPEDAKFNVEGVISQTVGRKEHHGPQAILRFRYMLDFLNGLDFDRFLIYEYDAISLEHVRDFPEEFAGNIFHEDHPGVQFLAPLFSHPPLVFSKRGLAKVCAEMKQMPEMESGMWDRYLGLAIHRAGLTVRNFMADGTGYAHNTIHENQYDDVRRAIMKGAVHLHGVKQIGCLQVIELARKRKEILNQAQDIKMEEMER